MIERQIKAKVHNKSYIVKYPNFWIIFHKISALYQDHPDYNFQISGLILFSVTP